MLDFATVLTKGGLVLFSKSYSSTLQPGVSVPNHPVDALVRDVLVEERSGKMAEDGFNKDSWKVKWTFENKLGLIFVIVYQKILQLTYIDELLELFKRAFTNTYGEELTKLDALSDFSSFEEKFDDIVTRVEAKDSEAKKHRKPRTFQETAQFANTVAGQQPQLPAKEESNNDSKENDDSTDSAGPTTPNMSRKLAALRGGRGGARGRGRGGKSAKPSPSRTDSEQDITKGKQKRTWVDGLAGSSSNEKLDFSDTKEGDDVAVPEALVGTAVGSRTEDGVYDALEMDDAYGGTEDEFADILAPTEEETKASKPTGVFGFLRNLTSAKTLTKEDLDPLMLRMRDHLISKNVAAEIATHLCGSISAGLVGEKVGAFTTLKSAVKQHMEPALKRILTPRTSTDVLRDIFAAKAQGRPYSIVFVGVNGVGKSTNLSKVCFWLLQNRLKVLIAACDTFRSGAVEQLRVHARNLTALEEGAVVDLFDRGYGKDPAGIAKDAIHYAKTQGHDVVLVDTAGRMQDNEPLMRALAKLVSTNDPDKIIFVGEALVGNEAVDQLTKFNQALKDFSGLQTPRQIDGIILTKFDTIDDKVGAALSMTYITGQPILFVGMGQTYTDLRKMNVKSIVNSLLAGL
ncbi:hypothetical protein HK097_000097 [Rhizophlyctis rosea]|uniref:SRP54-type proteins GTP-binding domain-containing protein n=1 Tax=Rhizophlyctis rosea TaxID=64517 RepID=A0AAD5SI23_9FUNG|nr:hypothetical protein HK097_000097 [Rhizophlyctis rosea]